MSRTLTAPAPAGGARAAVRPALAIVAFLALFFTGLVAASPASAADAPPAGTYTGTTTDGHQLSFTVDPNGAVSEFDTMSWIYCGVPPLPSPAQWWHMPPTPVTAGEAFDIEWQVEVEGMQQFFRIENFVINADGTASGGDAWADTIGLPCSGGRFSFTASLDGDVPGPGPQPGDPAVVLQSDTYHDNETQTVGLPIRGENFPADTDVQISFVREDRDEEVYTATARSDSNGVVFHRYLGKLSDDVIPRWHTVTLTASDGAEEFTDDDRFRILQNDNRFRFYDRDIVIDPSTITQTELAGSGIRFSSEQMDADSTAELFIDGASIGEYPTDGNGHVVADVFVSDSLGVGAHEAAFRSESQTGSPQLPTTHQHVAWDTFIVEEDVDEPEPVYEPEASVSPQSLTRSELDETGITIIGEGFAPDSEVRMNVVGSGSPTASGQTDGDGSVEFSYFSASLPTGTHTVELTSIEPELSASADFTVTEDPVVYEPEATVSPAEVTESELADTGVTFTGSGFAPESDVTLAVGGTQTETRSADADGGVEFVYVSDSLGVGTHDGLLSSAEGDASVRFTVIEDAPVPGTIPGVAPIEADLEPAREGKISAPAEAGPGETIAVTVDGVQPGTEVGVWMFSDATYLGTHEVDQLGQVTVAVPTDAELGETKLAVWAAGEPDVLIGWSTITIVDAGDGGGPGPGGGGSEPGSGGGDAAGTDGSEDGSLAVTGASSMLLLIAAGAFLLALGAGLVLLRVRRRAIG